MRLYYDVQPQGFPDVAEEDRPASSRVEVTTHTAAERDQDLANLVTCCVGSVWLADGGTWEIREHTCHHDHDPNEACATIVLRTVP